MIDLARRVVVAFPPVGEAIWSGIGPVGLLRFRDAGEPRLAVAVRVTSPFPAEGEPFLPGEPVPLPASPRAPDGAPLRGRELAPYKQGCDVGLVGTLVAAGDGATEGAATIELAVGDVKRHLSLTLGGPRASLGEARAVALGEGEVRLGPREIEPLAEYAQIDLGDGTAPFQSADPPLRFPYPEVGTVLALSSDFIALRAELGFEVFVRIDYLDGTISLPVSRCDAATIDLDRRVVEWVFRAIAHDPSEGHEIERIVVAALAPGQDEARAHVDAWLPHAAFSVAGGPEHARADVHPAPLHEEELTMARYATWDLGAFAHTLPIEEVARVQVELTRRKDRGAVLAEHGLDAYGWSVEEKAAMERLSEAGLSAVEEEGGEGAGEDEVMTRYREAYAQAMAEVPDEGRAFTVAEYAELRAAMEARNPVRVLERAGLGPGEVIALDQAMEARFEASPEERAEFDERFAAALERLEAEGDGEAEFEPPAEEDAAEEDDA